MSQSFSRSRKEITLRVEMRVPVSLLQRMESKIPPRKRSAITRRLWLLYVKGFIKLDM